MAVSGFAGLGYQIVWTQQCALWLGHETAAVLAVVAAFFGGLAVGALLLGPRIDRSQRPVRWYAGCEVLIAVWSLALALLIDPVSAWLIGVTGAQPTALWQWAVAFGGTFALLLPATAAMGATLPAMERITAAWLRDGRSVPAMYAANTVGAVLGVLASAFWLVPQIGLVRTAAVCAALNLLCAVGAVLAFRTAPSPLGRHGSVPAAATPPKPPPPPRLVVLLAATGLLGIGYEVLVVRVLSQVAENTVYTFAMLLAVYLVGTAAGAEGYRRWLAGPALQPLADRLTARLLLALAGACLLGSASLWLAERVKSATLASLGTSMPSALTAEAALALLAFGLPTVAMGALFSHLGTQARGTAIGFGRALGINTLGAAVAPALFGVLLLPAFGAKTALLTASGGYLLLMLPWGRERDAGHPAVPSSRAPARSRGGLALPATVGAGLAALAVWAPPLAFIDLPPGGRIVSYAEGATAAVSVVEDAEGVSRLRIDNRQQEGSSSSLLADARQALLPLLLHPDPRRALFLGLGTGMTARSAAQDPQLLVDAVELLPEVIAASAHFAAAVGAGAGDGAPNPRLHLMAADARRYVRASNQTYDLIVSDNFHPARSGSGSLYTVEHFRAVRQRLAPGGLFCQWLPLHQLDLPTLRSIVAAFVRVNPGAVAILATHSLDTPVLGLVARPDSGRFDIARLQARLDASRLPRPPADFGITDALALLGSVVAGPAALTAFAAGAPVNTDDHPVVAYRAPRITYAPDSLPRDRLLSLLAELRVDPAEVVDVAADADAARRLADYWTARNRFIAAGRNVRPSADVQQMLAQVQAPLLAVLRTSPDFRPAYDPLLQLAAALAAGDAPGAVRLLAELQRIQPDRPEAAQAAAALRALASAPVAEPPPAAVGAVRQSARAALP